MPIHRMPMANRSRLTRRCATILAATLLVLLAGCGRAQPNEVTFKASGGSEGRVGDIVVSDAAFAFHGPLEASAEYQPGDTVSVRATIVNEGQTPDRLISVSSPIAGGGVIEGDGLIPSRHALTAGYTGPAASTLPDTASIDVKLTNLNTAIRAGLTYPVMFTFTRAGQLQLPLRVDTPDRPREECPLPPNGRPPRVFTAPIGQAPLPPLPPLPGCSSIDEQHPRLLRVSAQADDTDPGYDEVVLRLLPGSEVALTSIEESDDGKVRLPDSNETVHLAGDQALRVTVSPALLGDPGLIGDVRPLPDLASIAEVRVLGSTEGQTVLGIGTKGKGELAPQADNTEARTVIRIKHPPYPPASKRECGSILLVRPESRAGSEASHIEATGASCDAARDVAGFARTQVGKPYDTPTGYSCQVDKRELKPAVIVEYRCSQASAQVTFTVS